MTIERKIHVSPSYDRTARYNAIFWFNACAPTFVLASSYRGIEDALEEAADVLSSVSPGSFVEPDYPPGFEWSEETAHVAEEAEADLTYTESGWLESWEWGLIGEGLSPREIADFAHRRG